MTSRLAEEKLEGAKASGVTKKRKAAPGEGKEEKKEKKKRAKSAAVPVATLKNTTKTSRWFVDTLPHQEPALNADDNRPFTLESIVRLFAENLLANFLRKLFGHAQKQGWTNGNWFLAGCAFGTTSEKSVIKNAQKPREAKQADKRKAVLAQWATEIAQFRKTFQEWANQRDPSL
jgi:hypothetical protein